MARERKARKKKIRFSKLLSFAGGRRRGEGGAGSDLVGTPGFSRVVHCNEPHLGTEGYAGNYISTTKYNALTFFPKALFEQFRRVANCYFLLAAVLSVTPLSPYTAASLIAPLVFVVGLSMTKEAIEDWRRWAADQEVNKRKTLVHVGGGQFEEREWRAVRVGDVLRVEKDEFFPTDLLLLASSYPDGICYVETMNLDGETNLKLRKALERTLELDDDPAFTDWHARITCEDPNPSLYTFVGNVEFGGETSALGPQQILLRDSKLRNTPFVYGVAVFTGHDTKAMQNSTAVPSKRSRIERRMDSIIYMLFGLLVLISVAGAIVFGIRTGSDTKTWWYLEPQRSDVYFKPSQAALAAILQAITGLVLYGYLIPISLYVTVEIVKVLQALNISNDLHMYYAESDTPARARTSNLNEELGQVDTILSDKTGTLTCNQMEFLKCSVAGVAYGRGITEVERATAKRLGTRVEDMDDYEGPGGDMYNGDAADGTPMKPLVKGFALRDERLLKGKWMNEPNAEYIRLFLQILAVCHTAIPEEDEVTHEITYEAESPDEAAFVIAARQLGFEFLQRNQASVVVNEPVNGQIVGREYQILDLLEFNSTRKRMSVVIRTPEGRLVLFCKGADSVIFERLGPNGRDFLTVTRQHLQTYGEAGLRTLALAFREIGPAEYEAWSREFVAAKTSLGADREARIDAASEAIENNLTLVGATAVEDKLQQGVPDAIDRLAKAGLKLWVLTGDKVETAINIGFACSLLRQDMAQIIINLDSDEIQRVEEMGDKAALKEVCMASVKTQIRDGAGLIDSTPHLDDTVFALIIDGKSLTYALEDSLKPLFLGLAMQCASVICCRVSPKQKALVTRLVKEGTGKVTLGIGDGANDVGMIQEAHIGVGISGVEGQQAVMASDFAIAQFRYLERLLLVHGHWSYKRIARMITYFFYKNIAFGMTLFYYNAYTVFSGSLLYNSWYDASYNVFFTSLPVIALGILEQDVPANTCLDFPVLYQQGPRNVFFTWAQILGWMANGFYVSIISFWFGLGAFYAQALSRNGRLPELAGLGVAIYTTVVWTVNLQILVIQDYLTWIHHVVIWGSIFLYYLFMIIYGYIDPSFTTTGYEVFTEVLAGSTLYWLFTLLLPVACLLPYFIYKTAQTQYFPMDHDIVKELSHMRKDVEDPLLWAAEGHRATTGTRVGFSANVNAVVRRMQRKGKLKKGDVSTI